MYVPAWLTALLGPLPPMPLTQSAPPAPFPVPPTPVMPPCQHPQSYHQRHHHSTLVTPWWLGPMPNYYLAPAQPYPNSYLLGPWPPSQQYYAGLHGHIKEDSETAKPKKFTGQDPSNCTLSLLAASWLLTANLTSS